MKKKVKKERKKEGTRQQEGKAPHLSWPSIGREDHIVFSHSQENK